MRYINEVRVGQQVSIRTRAIGRSDRRFHFLHFMTNDDTAKLSATLEAIGTHVDLPHPAFLAVPRPSGSRIPDHLLAEYSATSMGGPGLRGHEGLKDLRASDFEVQCGA